MKRFLVRSIIVSVVLYFVGWIVYSQVIPQYYHLVFPFIVIFFFLTTNTIHFYLLRIAHKDILKFSTLFMALSSVKMFFYLIVGISAVLLSTVNVKVFLLNFMVVYVIYTVLEVIEISDAVKMKK